mmetsp:Transcript_14821/g.17014  ORF Transcript_14821/g.17014 Transcript_14821/m.17014 type:complete len:293 (+) Transcript_14821:27-905(+)
MESFGLNKIELPNGETYAYREAGSGDKTLLLIHGNMSSSLFYDTLVSHLKDFVRVIAVDLRGFGHSTYNKNCEDLGDWADDINLFLSELKIEKVSVMGWSTGGGISLKLASKYPEKTEKVILMSSVGIKGIKIPLEGIEKPTLKDLQEKFTYGQFVETSMKNGDAATIGVGFKRSVYTSGRFPEPEKFDAYMKEVCLQRNFIEVVYRLMTFNISEESNNLVEGTGEIKKIKNEILILHGDADKVVLKEEAEGYAKAFGAQATLKILPDCDHSPLTFDVEAVSKAVLEFLGAK